MKLQNINRGDSFLKGGIAWVVLAQVDKELERTVAVVRKVELDGSYFPGPEDIRWGVCWCPLGDEVDEIVKGESFEIPEYLDNDLKTQLGKPLMTRKEAIRNLKAAKSGTADRVLCDFLTALGYSDVSDAYCIVKETGEHPRTEH